MPSSTKLLSPRPAIIYTRQSNGTVTEVVNSDFRSVYTGSIDSYSTDVARRPYPKSDLWGNGTGWNAYKEVYRGGIGRMTIGANQWEVAPSARWWTGSISRSQPTASELSGLLRAKVKDSNLNLAQSLAEYRQTADLFYGLASDLVSTFRSLRSGRGLKDIAKYFRKPRGKIVDDVGNRWLQYQYGVRPLVNDIYGSCEALRKKLRDGQFNYVTVSRDVKQDEVQKWPSSSNPVAKAYCQIHHRCTIRSRYKITAAAVKQLSEVGITNPALLAWELIPYSFVVDWLFPVGNWLASLDALTGTSEFSYYYSCKTVGRLSGSIYGGSFARELDYYSRTSKQTNLPLPTFGYKPSLTLEKILSGMALLNQLR